MECFSDLPSTPSYLVLCRRPGQSILVGSSVEILVVAIIESVVRLEIARRLESDLSQEISLVSCGLHQCIEVSRDITLKVSRVCPREARLGISAPTTVPIFRSELCR